MIFTCSIETPLGTMTAAAENDALTGLWFVDQKYYPKGAAGWSCHPGHPVFAAVGNWLDDYFSGKTPREDALRLAPHGSTFQEAVWDALLRIPYGRTLSYGEIAREIARARGISAMSAQAVGGAVGHNPITILIPCHRVLGADGKLTGYAGGLQRKEALLKLEGAEF